MYAVKGSYVLDIEVGQTRLDLQASSVKTFVICQDMWKTLPSFSACFIDSSGGFTHITPSDKKFSQWHISAGLNELQFLNSFDFRVLRSAPEGVIASSSVVKIDGVLDCGDESTKQKIRSFNGSLIETITTLGMEMVWNTRIRW